MRKFLKHSKKYGGWKKMPSKKWVDPVDRLIEADKKSNSLKEYLNAEKATNSLTVIEIEPSQIIRWEYKDRPLNELGDVEELAKTFQTVGQQQPCVVRKSTNEKGKYELIVGERRWRAAEIAKLKLKAIVQDMDDHTAALVQAVENEKRSDISDYAKGISYADKIEKKLITQKDLIEILGISKQQVSRLLSFKKIPSALTEAIDDFRKVSARTAEELSRLSAKGQEYIDALLPLAEKIRSGDFGGSRIIQEVTKKINADQHKPDKKLTIEANNGTPLFTVTNLQKPTIQLSKETNKLLQKNNIDLAEITGEIKQCLENKLGL